MDFTIKIYQELLKSLQTAGFSFLTFAEHLTQSRSLSAGRNDYSSKESRQIILRHDVDLLPHHSLRFAQIQHSMGIKGSYYFRAVPESWNEEVITEIARLGHEVGYHYENLDAVLSGNPTLNIEHQTLNTKYSTPENLIDHAYQNFQENLAKLRKLTKVETICMHGSPRAKYDNKAIWKKYDYKKLGLLGEPYYDMDFNQFFYLTDTGRKWDGWKTSVRDKVPQQEEWIKQGLVFKTTRDIINALDNKGSSSGVEMPHKIMFTFHPQRWNSSPYLWTKELVLQNVKNQVKRFLVKK
jgi:hypothetical protein